MSRHPDKFMETLPKIDRRLYRAYTEGFTRGYEYGLERDWPVGTEMAKRFLHWRGASDARRAHKIARDDVR